MKSDPKTPDADSQLRLIAKVLRELLAVERFEEFADLKEALLARLRALQIRYRQCDFDDAITLVGASTPLVESWIPGARPVEPQPEPAIIGRDEATTLSQTFLQRYHQEHEEVTHPLQNIAALRPAATHEIQQRHRTTDRARAFRLVLQDIIATRSRCDALEAAIAQPAELTQQIEPDTPVL